MTVPSKLSQLRKIRKLKVDRQTIAVARCRAQLNEAEAALVEAQAEYDHVMKVGASAIETLMMRSDQIRDPHTRFMAVQRTIVQQRNAEANARRRLALMQKRLKEARAAATEAQGELAQATHQLGSLDTLIKRAEAEDRKRAEELEEEIALEEFAAKHHGRGEEGTP